MRRSACAMVLAFAVTSTLAACGDDDGDGGGGSAPLSESEYIAAGDELCADADAGIQAAFNDIASDLSDATDIDDALIAQLVSDEVARILQDLVDDLRALEGPEDLMQDVNGLLDEVDEIIQEIENDPTVLDGIDEDPFAGFIDLGFEVCGSDA